MTEMADRSNDRVRSESKDPGWRALFKAAFKGSRNPMVLLDDQRLQIEVNGAYLQLLGQQRTDVIGHPIHEVLANPPMMPPSEWHALLRRGQFTGVADLVCRDGRRVKVQYAGHPEMATGRHLLLVVVVRTARGTRRLRERPPDDHITSALTGREADVVGLIAHGLSGPEIAEELHVTHNTVRTHARNAMTKTGARSRAHLVAKSLAEGLYWNTN